MSLPSLTANNQYKQLSTSTQNYQLLFTTPNHSICQAISSHPKTITAALEYLLTIHLI